MGDMCHNRCSRLQMTDTQAKGIQARDGLGVKTTSLRTGQVGKLHDNGREVGLVGKSRMLGPVAKGQRQVKWCRNVPRI